MKNGFCEMSPDLFVEFSVRFEPANSFLGNKLFEGALTNSWYNRRRLYYPFFKKQITLLDIMEVISCLKLKGQTDRYQCKSKLPLIVLYLKCNRKSVLPVLLIQVYCQNSSSLFDTELVHKTPNNLSQLRFVKIIYCLSLVFKE